MTKTCECTFCLSSTYNPDKKCGKPSTRDCETCNDSICDDCYYDSHDYGRCKDR